MYRRAVRLALLGLCVVACSSAAPPPPDRPTLVATPADAAMPDAAAQDNISDVTDPALPASWKYAAYFDHMKKEVYRAWDPISIYKALPSGVKRNLPPTVTIVLHVVLLPDGAVDSVTVKTSSTVLELDTESVRAFRAAGPFSPVPDPPPKLDFDFTLFFEIARNPSDPAPPPGRPKASPI
jgi:TonB family protein